jgi:hypothetical protein
VIVTVLLSVLGPIALSAVAANEYSTLGESELISTVVATVERLRSHVGDVDSL